MKSDDCPKTPTQTLSSSPSAKGSSVYVPFSPVLSQTLPFPYPSFEIFSPDIQFICKKIFSSMHAAGGQALFVGGCVRDALLDIKPKDIDIEVFGIEAEKLEALLKQHFSIDTIGKSFGVIKIRGYDIDIGLPRRESKSSSGHKGFNIESNPSLSLEEAASRRDFTINAISWNPFNNQLFDPFQGILDLKQKILRHVSNKFSEDPLRVLRGMQFMARFELSVAPETLAICKTLTPHELPKERLFEEWSKLILKGKKISRGLIFLKDSGWINFFPELQALIDCPQDPEWHPEGDVWIHTLHCMDAFANERIGNDWEDLIIGFATLCHDFGKPATTFTDSTGRIRSPNHEKEGELPTQSFLKRITDHKDLVHSILPLVLNHLRPIELYKAQSSDASIRRLAKKVKRIDRLLRVVSADLGGRPPKPRGNFEAGKWLLERAHELSIQDSEPKPIIQGRHLIERGIAPGPIFKAMLHDCFEAQIDGKFHDLESGFIFLDHYLQERARLPE